MSALFFIEESEAASHIPVLSRHLCIHAHQDYSARSHPASMPPVTLVHPWTSSLCLAPTGSASRMSRYGHPWPLTTLVLPCTSSAVQNRSRRFCLTPRGSHASILLKTKTAPNGTVCVLAERVGFEPTEGRPSPVFKTGAFDQLSHLSRNFSWPVFCQLYFKAAKNTLCFIRFPVPIQYLRG